MIELEGTLERITYQNEENYYTVARLECKSQKGLVTIVGHLGGISAGETLKVSGNWFVHSEYGRQFRVERFEVLIPATLAGIEKYLGSGLINGVGPVTAKKIVEHFGEESLEVIENAPGRLTEISGIGEKKAQRIAASFNQQKEIRQVMLFLQNYGVSPAYAAKIYKQYGDNTIAVIKDNPYRLAEDVFGIGFKTADKLAAQMGIAKDSPYRIIAGARYVLGQSTNEGHVYLPVNELVKRCKEVLESEEGDIALALEELAYQRSIYIEQWNGEEDVYLAPFYYAEKGVAERLKLLANRQTQLSDRSLLEDIAQFQKEQKIQLAKNQVAAVHRAMESGVLVVTGGPGTGKTTTINAIIHLFEKQGYSVGLCAPTGRAAKRMTEATGREAKTIHRLLEYSFAEGEGLMFQRNEESPLRYDVVIVDEVSMVDILLMYALLKAIEPGTRLILVGDKNQLPSVGPGNVLGDIIASGMVDVVELKEIFRQAQESMIVINAHRINRGDFPYLNVKGKDFFFIEGDEPEELLATLLELCTSRLPQFGNFDPMEDLQVLSPMRRTLLGVENLNEKLQEVLNPPAPYKPEFKSSGTLFRLGDKIMQTKNNYEKMVFNGDIGKITHVDKEEGEAVVTYPDAEGVRKVVYQFGEFDECALAYAVSVHKSQGSEYPVVIMPVTTQHYMMLQRNLLYTGITRAKKLVVLLGSKKALGIAVRNHKVSSRWTRLGERLQRG